MLKGLLQLINERKSSLAGVYIITVFQVVRLWSKFFVLFIRWTSSVVRESLVTVFCASECVHIFFAGVVICVRTTLIICSNNNVTIVSRFGVFVITRVDLSLIHI